MRRVAPQHAGFCPDHRQGSDEIPDAVASEIAAQQPHRRVRRPSITLFLAENRAGATPGGGQAKGIELENGSGAVTWRGAKHDRLAAADRLFAKGRLHEILPCL